MAAVMTGRRRGPGEAHRPRSGDETPWGRLARECVILAIVVLTPGVRLALIALVGACASLGACAFEVSYDGSRYACTQPSECPEGFTCGASGFCGPMTGELPPDAALPPPDAPVAPPPDAPVAPPDAALPPPPDANVCEGGVSQTQDPETGHCYALFTSATTWAGARTACQAWGGDLAKLTSAPEAALASSLVTGNVIDAWLGGTDAQQEMTWRWFDGTLVTFANWRMGEPNDGGGQSGPEDCMIIELDMGGTWDDRPCGSTYPYVCER
jgi:hypothetical protein